MVAVKAPSSRSFDFFSACLFTDYRGFHNHAQMCLAYGEKVSDAIGLDWTKDTS